MQQLKRFIYIVLILFLLFSLTRNIFNYVKTLEFYENFKTEYEKEALRRTQLKTQILKKNDPHEVEKVARNKLNLLKPGETALILPSPTPSITLNNLKTQSKEPIYRQWLHLYLGF